MIKRRNYGRNHAYFDVVGEGEQQVEVKLPGVTAITAMKRKPGIERWRGKATASYAVDNWRALGKLKPAARLEELLAAADKDRDEAAGRGTAVHALGVRLAHGEDVEPPEELRAHVESYARFIDAYDVGVVAAELVLGNRHVGYCGTTDLIADLDTVRWRGELLPPARWLLDLKTGRSGIFPETALQCCAYCRAEVYLGTDLAEHPLTELGIERCGAVHVRGDGYDLVPLDTGEQCWSYFQHLAWLWYHDEFPAGWVGEAAEPPAALAAAP